MALLQEDPMTESNKAREEARNLLNEAASHYERGEYEAALELCREAVELDPKFADGIHFQGIVHLARGETGEAEGLVRRALELDGDRTDFLQNLAVILMDRSALPEAIAILSAVFRAERDNAQALELLGRACFLIGDFANAADAYARLMGLEPDNVRARHNFTLALREAPLTEYTVENERFVVACLQLADIDHLHLTPSVVGQLLGKYGLADGGDAAAIDLKALGRDTLLLHALPMVYIANAQLEKMLIRVRNELLETRSLDEDSRRLVCGLGLYGLHTGFPWPVSAEEGRRCAALRRELYALAQGDPQAPAAQDAALRLAMYAPLAAFPETLTVVRTGPEAWPEPARELVLRGLHQPAERRQIAESIETLASPSAASPRPRGLHWQSMPPRTRMPFPEVLAARIPSLDVTALPARRPLRVLVVEAGSGRHALNVAALYADATVLALDASAEDLAYASQKAQEFKLQNVRFMRGEVSNLSALQEGFDVVEAPSGRITPADWDSLRTVLDSGGIVHVSTVMAAGRTALAQLLERLAVDPTDDESVRQTRQRVLGQEMDDAGDRLARALEFYTLPGSRELFTPVTGTSFSELWQAVAGRRFEFLGFSPIPARLAAFYRSEFPDEPTGRRLENWVALEQREPERVAALLGYARLGVWLRVLA